MNSACRVPIETSDGLFTAWFSSHGLIRLDFPGASRLAEAEAGESPHPKLPEWERLTADALRTILAGEKPAALPPLDWSGHTAFRQRVWRALLKIEPGKTETYAAVAAAIGNPSATRAAGGACGANPIPVLVPCHRVVAANGGLGGFSSGLDWKHRLLSREGWKEKRAGKSGARKNS